jgi:hypothetical protein
MQVVMDTLATAQNIPLRCMSGKHLANLFQQKPHELGGKISKHFPSKEAFFKAIDEIASDPVEGFRRIRDQAEVWNYIFGIDPLLEWVTLPSFSSPLFVLLRENKYWSIWETIWCLKNAMAAQNRGGPVDDLLHYGGPFGDRLNCAVLGNATSDFIIFAGPTWRPWPLNLSEEERQTECEKILQALLSALVRPPKEYSDGISRDRIFRSALSREPLVAEELKTRLSNAVHALDCVLATDIPDIALAAHEYEAIALHFLELANHPKMLIEAGRAFPLPRGAHTKDRPSNVAASELRVSAGGKSGPAGQVFQVPLTYTSGSVSSSEYDYAYHSLVERTGINRSNYMLERISLLRLWLQSLYLSLPIRDLDGEPAAESSIQILDRLSRRLMLLFGADACNIYQYDTIERQLQRRGSFVRYLEKAGDRKKAAVLMREAGNNPKLRQRSICYRCVETGKILFPANARDDEMLMTDSQAPPRHVLAIPLKIHDRTWGVIEIQALHPYQLLESLIRWANELARAVTPIIYDRLLLQNLGEMNNIVLGDRPAEEKYELILKHVAGLLMASSGALYLQHQRRTSEYECRAAFGRTPDGTPLSGFASDDPQSVSARILHKKDIEWETNEIGKPPFDEEWLKKPKNSMLRSEGHRFVAIFSLVNSKGSPFGSITITSKSDEEFGDVWTNLVRFLSRHVGVLVESIKRQTDQQDAIREYQAHAVKTRVDRVIGAAKRISEALQPFFDVDQLAPGLEAFLKKTSGSSTDLEVADALRTAFWRPAQPNAAPPKGRINLGRTLADLETHAAELRVSAVYISGGKNEEHPAHADPKSWEGTWADFRGCVLGSLIPLEAEHSPHIQRPTIHQLPMHVRIRMPSSLLQEIINNMIDNSYKYNFLPSIPPLISCKVDDKKRSAELELRNMAPALSLDEEHKVGEPRFRAEYARKRNRDGVGLGLAYCAREALRWGAVFNYRAEHNEGGSGTYVWHRARLYFPPECVRIV